MARIVLDSRPDDDLRRVLDWLDSLGEGGPGECTPAMDVYERPGSWEILADLPGVPASAIRVVCTEGMLVIAGHKLPRCCDDRDAAFHLAERGFGRFARAFRLAGAFDFGRARATLKAGELHVVLPRIEERRGREIRIVVEAD